MSLTSIDERTKTRKEHSVRYDFNGFINIVNPAKIIMCIFTKEHYHNKPQTLQLNGHVYNKIELKHVAGSVFVSFRFVLFFDQ